MALGIGHRRQNLINNKPFWDSILQNSRIVLNDTLKRFQKSDPVLFLLLTSGSGFPVLWSDNLCIAEGWRNCISGGSGNCSHAWRKRKRQRWGESCIGETNTWMPSQGIQTRMNSYFHFFILDKSWPWNCQGCFPMAGIRSELQSCQQGKASLFGEPLEVATGSLLPTF